MDIASLQKICQALPAVTEDIKWDHDLVFSVGGKMFCVAGLDGPFTCSFKVPDEEYEELSAKKGFEPAPYMARAKWVLVSDPTKMKQKEWESRVKASYEMVKSKLTKKLRGELGI
jgi:predicted DNA-binding protein (MmcQ/YjbR family)